MVSSAARGLCCAVGIALIAITGNGCSAAGSWSATIDLVHALPPPPRPETATAGADRAAVSVPVTDQRLAIASRDQSLDAFLAFGEVLGPGFQRAELPATAALLAAVASAVSGPVLIAKAAFPRERPYVADDALARCTPGPLLLAADESYPSGHAAIGMAWALVLAELIPSRSMELLGRGYDYGQSRVICGVHWPSDVAAGQQLADDIVAQLLGDPAWTERLDAARAELRGFI